ncbi:hypothetical protein [Terriglobus sp.]|uniref:hypothetical protein n=1 Tax=Terriglobus sp. TaxID=1889013 RepID=UPI003AFF93A4
MLKPATLHQRTGVLWQVLAVLFCIAFGLAHLLNVFTVGDGLWFWYASLVRSGQHLYSGLHMNQQPLFILLTAGALSWFGKSWIAFHIFPAIQVVLYSVGLMLVARYVPWRDRNRAMLILAAFGMTMTISYYRFDDYHVTTQILQVYSLWLLLVLDRDPSPRRALVIAALLGVFAGLSTSNRLNDGAALVAASGIALFGSAFHNRIAASLTFLATTAASFLSVILLTGDKLSVWYFYTVVQAAQIKGASGHIWLYPLILPFRTTLRFLKSPHAAMPVVYVVLVVICILLGPGLNHNFAALRRRKLRFFAWIAFSFLSVVFYVKNILPGFIDDAFSAIAVPFAYVLFLVLMVRFVRHLLGHDRSGVWHARELLLLIPMLQLFLAAMTGGHGETESSPAMALTILLLPIVTPVPFSANLRRGLALTAALLAIAAFSFKYLHPFAWHDYHADTMFADRVWYQHPDYGPIYLDADQLAWIKPVCKEIRAEPGDLLSLPYPHANYFCDKAPWHGYVQTWYDTSSKQAIEGLVHELQTAPPTWIFYERNLGVIKAHEKVYSNGQPLPQRKIDSLLMSRVQTGQWTLVHQQCLHGADWLLVRTSAPRPGEAADFPVIMNQKFNFCGRTGDYE